MPHFTATSLSGAVISSKQLEGHTFLAFVNSEEPYHIDLIKQVYATYHNKGLFVVVFASSEPAAKTVAAEIADVPVVLDNDEIFFGLFNAKSCCGSHFLYGPGGRLIANLSNRIPYDSGIKHYLRIEIDHNKFAVTMLFPDRNIGCSGRFSNVWSHLSRQKRDYYFILMISDACRACPISKLIGDLARITR